MGWIIGISILCIMFVIWSKRQDKILAEKRGILKQSMDENNITDNIKLKIDTTGSGYDLLLTNDMRLFTYDLLKGEIFNIEVKDILEVNINANVSEGASMKLIAIMPTFENYSDIKDATFEIMTETKKYNIKQNKNGLNMDDMKRMKIFIDREIEKLNKTNN